MRSLLGQAGYFDGKLNNPDPWQRYWKQRQDFVYMHVCKQLISCIASSATVVADIGSNRTPLLDFFPSGVKKYSVDPMNPYEGPDVDAIKADFFHWNPPSPIQFGTCLQTMEHVPDVVPFARRMMELCEVSLVSVPHLEPPGANPEHIHSMIDLDRIVEWFGRAPNYHYIAVELSGDQRIICVFDRTDQTPYKGFNRESLTALGFRNRWSLKDL